MSGLPHPLLSLKTYRDTVQQTYTQARAKLASLLDEVCSHREVVIIQRRKGEDVALIAASELSSLMETAYLLRSPVNAERHATPMKRSKRCFAPHVARRTWSD